MLGAPVLLSRTCLALGRRYPLVANPLAGWPPVLVKPRRSWSSGLQPMPLVKAKTSISCPLQLVCCSPFSHIRLSLSSGESMGLVRRSVLRALLLSLLFVGTMCTLPPGKTLPLLLWPQELLPRAPEEAWPIAIRLLSQPQARTSESTDLDARDTDKNQQVWNAKLVLATTNLHLAQFRQQHRPLAKAVDYADLFIYDAQQEAALSDLAILGALPRKCLVLRLGDPKQTSGGTGPSDLARQVRLVSDQLAGSSQAVSPGNPCLDPITAPG